MRPSQDGLAMRGLWMELWGTLSCAVKRGHRNQTCKHVYIDTLPPETLKPSPERLAGFAALSGAQMEGGSFRSRVESHKLVTSRLALCSLSGGLEMGLLVQVRLKNSHLRICSCGRRKGWTSEVRCAQLACVGCRIFRISGFLPLSGGTCARSDSSEKIQAIRALRSSLRLN